ncbi:symmetrical bis(5'-nucleosyl)-tetraphosphatase [Rubrivivax rivuli]|uniref:bis(5'-nucleosyl)-tetraphosphatase (symmetrical) n=1 Tax=Rubrivivax rivuli TaxID=1862385 RepID=A0A437RFL0_9BURK|nr:symmetrical bis(5'-nucleosyl)-tetraphosphatase [Rubrivivax rivuli]RVU45539.1 symmetrical bis(5'-nucleosyl)-tetraphosphatase [Rubrivivax rivuli]
MLHLIGDVQGCAQALQRLLAEIGFSPSRGRLVMLGDLVNRGPDSLGVLKMLSGFGDAATCLLGNHDLHLLAVAQGVRSLHKGDTFQDVLGAPESAHWLQWLRQQPLAHTEAGWLCVHAGLVPQWTGTQTLALAAEVQAVLRGPDLPGFLRVMYGNEPRRWADSLQGAERLRFIVNTLTRIRFCAADGTLDFKTKEGAGGAPPGMQPWFEVPGRRSAGEPIAFGHWSTLGLVNRPDVLALDTGCVWRGALTAVRVDGGRREVVQVDCEAAQRPG